VRDPRKGFQSAIIISLESNSHIRFVVHIELLLSAPTETFTIDDCIDVSFNIGPSSKFSL
jgi:hypothetical protein